MTTSSPPNVPARLVTLAHILPAKTTVVKSCMKNAKGARPNRRSGCSRLEGGHSAMALRGILYAVTVVSKFTDDGMFGFTAAIAGGVLSYC